VTRDDILRISQPWRQQHLRTAWRPKSDDAGASRSWFGGEPLVEAGFEWPVCASCSKPMSFFVQLDLAALPAEFDAPIREGLLQMFYCSSDDGSCETWAPFSGTHAIRIAPIGAQQVRAAPATTTTFPRTTITGWDAIEDGPHPEDFGQLGLTIDYDFESKRCSVRCSDPPFEMHDLDISLDVAEMLSNTGTGDKLGGWPSWVQGAEYPSCPDCSIAMTLMLQIDSEDNLPYMFGDMGCGHLTQCRTHPHRLAFGWACS
jgi:uncharacterized protein YwqG